MKLNAILMLRTLPSLRRDLSELLIRVNQIEKTIVPGGDELVLLGYLKEKIEEYRKAIIRKTPGDLIRITKLRSNAVIVMNS